MNNQDKIVQMFYKELNDIKFKWQKIYELNDSGGKMRGDRGNDIEILIENIINQIGIIENINIKAMRGYKDKKKLIFQNEKKNIFKYHNSDIHIYFDNKFVAIIECKAYLDSCYFTRACSDFRLFKKFNYKLKNIILSLENSINTDSAEFINYSYGNVCHKIFYLLNEKRSASKPIYDKKYDKKIDASATLSVEATEYGKKN